MTEQPPEGVEGYDAEHDDPEDNTTGFENDVEDGEGEGSEVDEDDFDDSEEE